MEGSIKPFSTFDALRPPLVRQQLCIAAFPSGVCHIHISTKIINNNSRGSYNVNDISMNPKLYLLVHKLYNISITLTEIHVGQIETWGGPSVVMTVLCFNPLFRNVVLVGCSTLCATPLWYIVAVSYLSFVTNSTSKGLKRYFTDIN